MKKTPYVILMMLAAVMLLTSCGKKPSDDDIRGAIMKSIEKETDNSAEVPSFNLDYIEVPMRSSDKAWAVVWNGDRSVQRNYVIEYDKKEKAFRATSFTESVYDGDSGTYREK